MESFLRVGPWLIPLLKLRPLGPKVHDFQGTHTEPIEAAIALLARSGNALISFLGQAAPGTMAAMPRCSPPVRGTAILLMGLGLTTLAACDVGPQSVGGEVVATVAGRSITERDVAAQRAYLSEFGALSLGDDQPSKAILARALVEASVMAEAGRREGLGAHPRFAWAMRVEDARLEGAKYVAEHDSLGRGPEFESALIAWYAANEEAFREQELRAFNVVVFDSFKDARAAISTLSQDPTATLSDFGDVGLSPESARDDVTYPTVHPFVFDPSLSEGDVIPRPLLSGVQILVAQLVNVRPAGSPSLDDPGVRQRVIASFEAARREALVIEYVEQLQAASAGATEP
jgi:hypothetical protein